MTFTEKCLAHLIYLFYKMCYRTYRVSIQNPWWENPAIDQNKPVVLAHWHEDDMALIGRYGFTGFNVIVSLSKDGNLISYVLKKLGCNPVRGSSSRGGAKALLSMIKILRETNGTGALTVDGPRGPRHRVKPGIVALGQKADAQILALSAVAPKRFVFKKSWSRTYLPLPFSRVYHRVSVRPFRMPEDDSPEEMERTMTEIENELISDHNKLWKMIGADSYNVSDESE